MTKQSNTKSTWGGARQPAPGKALGPRPRRLTLRAGQRGTIQPQGEIPQWFTVSVDERNVVTFTTDDGTTFRVHMDTGYERK